MVENFIKETKPMDGFARDGFKGMRRTEINKFAKPFFITEDNPNGTIEPFPDDMEKKALDSMMSLYLGQGKFGDDPFNLRPKDEMADLRKQVEELKAMYQGPRANPATEVYKPPPAKITEAMVQAPSVSLPGGEDEPVEDMPKFVSGEPYVTHEDMDWSSLRAKAKGMGIETWKKTRTVVIAEIEAKEAE